MATQMRVEVVCEGPHADEMLIEPGTQYQAQVKVKRTWVLKDFCAQCAEDLAPYLGFVVPSAAPAPVAEPGTGEVVDEVPFGSSSSSAPAAESARAMNRMIREWAISEGKMTPTSRGRIPATVREDYAAHHPTRKRGRRSA